MAHVFQVAAGVPASWPWKAQQLISKRKWLFNRQNRHVYSHASSEGVLGRFCGGPNIFLRKHLNV